MIKKSVDIQGEPIACELYGDESAQADVVLIHGFTGSKEDFKEVAGILCVAGFRVLTFDNRGQHESGHSSRADGYSMESLGRDLLELKRAFGMRKPHLLGHSFGGLIAQQAVALDPSEWSSLTLFCSGPAGRKSWLQEPHFLGLSNSNKGQIWSEFLERDRLGNSRFDLLKTRWLNSDAKSTLAFRDHLLHHQSLISEIARLNIPAHVVYGETDDAWPITEQNEMARELGAEITVLTGCGHCPNEDDPRLTASELARFWNSVSR